ncbi:hypothetical protein [Feifania hominis]|uniref:Uncharacterized protein n=1 Tax=Feifania hominis TaxID=2763660 RepID=A0A926HW18_9FIRM|nr:hypothetical protein [Feifania hominis]MBC8537231.1 hypothetical protein [Feifania hominis]
MGSRPKEFPLLFEFCRHSDRLADGVLAAREEIVPGLDVYGLAEHFGFTDEPEENSLSLYQGRAWYLWQLCKLWEERDGMFALKFAMKQAIEQRERLIQKLCRALKDRYWAAYLEDTPYPWDGDWLHTLLERKRGLGADSEDAALLGAWPGQSVIDRLLELNMPQMVKPPEKRLLRYFHRYYSRTTSPGHWRIYLTIFFNGFEKDEDLIRFLKLLEKVPYATSIECQAEGWFGFWGKFRYLGVTLSLCQEPGIGIWFGIEDSGATEIESDITNMANELFLAMQEEEP